MPASLSRPCLALAAAGLLLVQAAPADSATAYNRLSVSSAHSAEAGPGRVIVTYRSTRASALSARVQAQGDAPVREAQTLSQRHALNLRDGRTVAPRTQVLLSDTLSSEQLREKLAADPDIASVTIDRRRYPHAAPNDPLYAAGQPNPYPSSGQWYLRAPSGSVVSAINAEGAWSRTTGSSSVVVAVLDTGVRPEHPDLQGKLLPGYDFVHQVANSNDGDGLDGDPSDPGDWISAADLAGSNRVAYSDCSTSESTWHGTQTAALVGASTNNGVGMASVGRNILVLPVRVLGKCGGFDSDIIAGMRWAAGLAVDGTTRNSNPAKVINLSLGYPDVDPITQQRVMCTDASSVYPAVLRELTQAGVLVVASAGNDDLAVNTPAQCPGVVAVAGLRHAGDKMGYSSLGREVFIAAPGGNCEDPTGGTACAYMVLSASNAGTQGPSNSRWTDAATHRTGYEGIGTSFSAPLVSATAALMWSVNSSLTTDQLTAALRNSARPFTTTGGIATKACTEPAGTASTNKQINCYCTTTTCGAGMLDTQAAVQAAAAGRPVAHLGDTPPMVTPGATVSLDGSASTDASGTAGQGLQFLWELVDGTGLATITSANNASSVTLSTLASATSGRFTVKLTVTDANNATASATQTFTLGTPTTIVTHVLQAAPAADTGGGGGAFDSAWALLAALIAGIAWRARRPAP